MLHRLSRQNNIMSNQAAPNTPLLEPLETVVVPAVAGPVMVKDYLSASASLTFSKIWAEFKNRFFDKTEPRTPEVTYRKYRLARIAPDGPIIAELGGPAKVEGNFIAACELMRRQGNGEDGFLQTNGYANIFYAKDKKGELCAIRIGWDGNGWVLDAISVADPLAWNGRHEIFCPVS
jgi:hypothetical protein